MASSFWQSTHCKRWLLTREQLPSGRESLGGTTMWMVSVGAKAKLRYRVVASGIVFLRRFAYAAGDEYGDYAPEALAVACLYVASKAEESTVHAKHWVRYAEASGCTLSLNDLFDLEMHVLEGLQTCLVVFHPYRPLLQLIERCSLPREATGRVTADAWALVNDSYQTDCCLLYPPHLIAVAALYASLAFNEMDLRPEFAALQVDLDEVYEVARIVLDAHQRGLEAAPKDARALDASSIAAAKAALEVGKETKAIEAIALKRKREDGDVGKGAAKVPLR